VRAYVFDDDHHKSFAIGRSLIGQVLEGSRKNDAAHSTYKEKDSPDLLSLEIYPLHEPVDLLKLEIFFRELRSLYNIILIGNEKIPILSTVELDKCISEDKSIPSEYQLRLSAIDRGSIFVSLSSASRKSLKRLADIFDKGATAKLAAEIAESGKAELDLSISQEVRAETARRVALEQEALSAKSIAETYSSWRREVRSNLKLFNDLISEVSDPVIRQHLIEKKDQALKAIVEQRLMPIVRNIPRQGLAGEEQALDALDTPLALPPARSP
jgi:hypothetical protein